MRVGINGARSGILENIFMLEELREVEKIVSQLPNPFVDTAETNNKFYGINEEHKLYNFFSKKIFSKIQQYTGPEVKLLFGSLLVSINPFGLHSDYYHKRLGEPYMAFLVPLTDDVLTHTIIFNEEDTSVSHGHPTEKRGREPKEPRTIKENNALPYKEEYLSHISEDELRRVTLQNILRWKIGNVIFWDEKLVHCSDNYVKHGKAEKRAFVLHTYTN